MVLRYIRNAIRRLNAVRGKTVLRVCFAASLVFHTAMLLGIHQAFPVNWFRAPVETYEVELLRPPVDADPARDEAAADMAGPQEKQEQDQETEDTISLDTKDRRYSSYAAVIRERLARHWEYPETAREHLVEGETRVLFSLNRAGGLTRIEMLDTSGADILDEETFRTIRAAAPFPPFPDSVTVTRLNIRANFAYRLTARK